MTSSNECPSEDQQGTEDPSNCFLPPDPHPVHSTTSNIDGIIFDPSHNGIYFQCLLCNWTLIYA